MKCNDGNEYNKKGAGCLRAPASFSIDFDSLLFLILHHSVSDLINFQIKDRSFL